MKGRCIESFATNRHYGSFGCLIGVFKLHAILTSYGSVANSAAGISSSLASWRNALAQTNCRAQDAFGVHIRQLSGSALLAKTTAYLVSASAFTPAEHKAAGGRRQRFYRRHNP